MERSRERLNPASPERTTLPKLFDECNKALEEAATYLFITRNSKDQRTQRDLLIALKVRIRGFKLGAVELNDERSANALFHAQSVLNAIIACLNMLLLVKQKEYNKAWSALIDAHEYISVAKVAHDDGFNVDSISEHLTRLERGIFPSIGVYHSWGAIIRGGTCTVCGKQFNTCEHVEGKVYWGKLCVRVKPELVSIDHSAIVTEPKDRRCITTEVPSGDGNIRDYFTWRVKRKHEPEPGTLGKIGIILFSNNLIEID